MMFRRDFLFPPPKNLLDMPLICPFKNTISSFNYINNSINHSIFGTQKSPFLPLNRINTARKGDEILRYQNLLWKREAESLHRGYQPKNKFNLFKLSADYGDIDSMYSVAMHYFFQSQNTKKKALRYFTVASDRGHPQSQYCLGMILLNGYIVKSNIQKALRLIRKSSENGFDEAQYMYGLALLTEFSVPRNEKEAYNQFDLASRQGNNKAKLVLGYMHAKGIGIEKDELKGIKIMKSVLDRKNFPKWGDGYYSFAEFLDKLVFNANKLNDFNKKIPDL